MNKNQLGCNGCIGAAFGCSGMAAAMNAHALAALNDEIGTDNTNGVRVVNIGSSVGIHYFAIVGHLDAQMVPQALAAGHAQFTSIDATGAFEDKFGRMLTRAINEVDLEPAKSMVLLEIDADFNANASGAKAFQTIPTAIMGNIKDLGLAVATQRLRAADFANTVTGMSKTAAKKLGEHLTAAMDAVRRFGKLGHYTGPGLAAVGA